MSVTSRDNLSQQYYHNKHARNEEFISSVIEQLSGKTPSEPNSPVQEASEPGAFTNQSFGELQRRMTIEY
ncbi:MULTISPECIES: hypothetical protein [Pseudomonas fluorescens group]|uniref:Uncharacterized protein n=1 Tax=Pseudomonas fluorescens TaxID=294 RepID=A0A0D0TG22_PSEFL|nr:MULTISPECIES: hypothetical protein [Pseudomonas fluorescens group]AZE60231.1 hypothetical protein C4K02_1855 [Pseudomonas synxantha]KIR19750.1 hypothetical protein PFLU3_47980 [Pseudomonas fluorescens]